MDGKDVEVSQVSKQLPGRGPGLLTDMRAVGGNAGPTAVYSVKVAISSERRGHPFEVYGREQIISVEKEEPVIVGQMDSGITSGTHSQWWLVHHTDPSVLRRKAFGDCSRSGGAWSRRL